VDQPQATAAMARHHLFLAGQLPMQAAVAVADGLRHTLTAQVARAVARTA
jgi:hypothetical protein